MSGQRGEVGGMTDAAAAQLPEADPRRWRALAVLALVQFMLILDITVVNVALPHIQQSLHFSEAGLAWVVDGYVLAAGGLLLLGGRLADIVGRRRIFLMGVGLFAAASLSCGLAQSDNMLVVSRFAQGMGEALAAPAAMGLIALLFMDPKERIKALGIWGGIAGLGGTSGTVISGIITNSVSWRWIFLINLPVALFALLVVPRLTSESRMERTHKGVDIVGALAITGSLIAVVNGFLAASRRGNDWGTNSVWMSLVLGGALLVFFVYWESQTADPLVPLRFFSNRTRVVTNGVTFFFASAFFTYFFLLTLFMQQILHYSPLRGGLVYVPFGLAIGAGIGMGTGLMPKVGVKALMTTGFAIDAVGLLLTSGISVHTSYWSDIFPGMVVLGFGSGLCFPAFTNASLHEVTAQDSGLASGVQNAMQQIAGAVGLAVFVTLAFRHAASLIAHGSDPAVATVKGYVLSYRVGAALLAAGAVAVALLLEHVDPVPRQAEAEIEVLPEASPA
jgi:EmrB/QacA subfamily drug resistance transporter